MVVAFQLFAMVAALALGFVLGRIWEQRREIQRDLSLRMSDSNFTALVGEVLQTLRLSLRARGKERSGMRRSEQGRVEPVIEDEPRELVSLMNAIREITERRTA